MITKTTILTLCLMGAASVVGSIPASAASTSGSMLSNNLDANSEPVAVAHGDCEYPVVGVDNQGFPVAAGEPVTGFTLAVADCVTHLGEAVGVRVHHATGVFDGVPTSGGSVVATPLMGTARVYVEVATPAYPVGGFWADLNGTTMQTYGGWSSPLLALPPVPIRAYTVVGSDLVKVGVYTDVKGPVAFTLDGVDHALKHGETLGGLQAYTTEVREAVANPGDVRAWRVQAAGESIAEDVLTFDVDKRRAVAAVESILGVAPVRVSITVVRTLITTPFDVLDDVLRPFASLAPGRSIVSKLVDSTTKANTEDLTDPVIRQGPIATPRGEGHVQIEAPGSQPAEVSRVATSAAPPPQATSDAPVAKASPASLVFSAAPLNLVGLPGVLSPAVPPVAAAAILGGAIATAVLLKRGL